MGERGGPRGLVPSRAGPDENREGGAGWPRDQATLDGMGVSLSHGKAQVHLSPGTEATSSQNSRAQVYVTDQGKQQVCAGLVTVALPRGPHQTHSRTLSSRGDEVGFNGGV